MSEGETEEPAKQIPAPAAKDAEFPEVAPTKATQDSDNKTTPRV
jgi:hypothetical protein